MNSRDFMYWLRGHLEANGQNGLTASKVTEINRHLSLAIQTEANAKRLAEDYDRARIAKMLHEAGRDDIVHQMSHRSLPAGC